MANSGLRLGEAALSRRSFFSAGRLRVAEHGGHGVVRLAEVLGDVGARAEQALLLAAPEADADGPPGLEVERLEDPDGLHRHGHAGRVVGGAGAAVPGVHVAAEHDDLVLQVGAGDLGEVL